MAELSEATSADTLLELNVKYRKDEDNIVPYPTLYRRLVGSLFYLIITRLDISFTVHTLSKFVDAPRHLHLVVVRCIICYLIGTLYHGLFFPRGTPLVLTVYSDAD